MSEPVNLTDWPRDPANGYLLCSPAKPMPKGASGRWAHTRIETVKSDSDFHYGTEWDTKRCKDCGVEWEQEVPQ
jgi:hypothetical protein